MQANSSSKNSSRIRVLIIDSSVECREYIKTALSEAADIEVVATAPNGSIGLIKVLDMAPDVVLFDEGIGDMTPVDFTKSSMEKLPDLGIIILVSGSPEERIIEKIIQALEYGAFDFIEKPDKLKNEERISVLRRKLLPKIRALSIQKYSRIARDAANGRKNGGQHESAGSTGKSGPGPGRKIPGDFNVVLIGASTGGPESLTKVIPLLPSSFPLPVIIVLHMPKLFTASMAKELNRKSELQVKEAQDNDIIQPGTVYLAHGGKHLSIGKNEKYQKVLKLDDSPPENGCKPSVDFLFRSAVEMYGKKTIAVIMTGMGSDGVNGIGALKEKGAVTIAQDKESSLIWGMPGSAVEAGYINEVLPVDMIAARIIELAGAN